MKERKPRTACLSGKEFFVMKDKPIIQRDAHRRTLRYTAVCGMLTAVSAVLQMLEFPLPFLIPSFIEMDFSDMPALLASFSMGPLYGVAVSLLKNVIHLFQTTTGGVGELANFLLSAIFSFTAGMFYTNSKSRKNALKGCIVGAVVAAVVSVPVNYFITYPVYYNFMPEEAILDAYQALLPWVKSIFSSLMVFNAPFTLLKGLLVSALTFAIYKPLSPIIKGEKRR